MTTLTLIFWVIIGVILIAGIIRVAINPYTDFVNFLMEIMLLDFLIDVLGAVFENIGDILD